MQMEGRERKEGKRRRRRRHPTAEEVIDRLRDNGDFDSLRLSLIRKLKNNEELRKSIIEEVESSLVLNEDGADKLKIRDLSDAIYQEVGSIIMGKISDVVWNTINSSEQEIEEVIDSVYNRILQPKIKKKNASTSAHGKSLHFKENEPLEPPGFVLPTKTANTMEHANLESENDVKPPGFGSDGDVDVVDEPAEDDLDAPPGFS
ncbi:ATP synthase subunit b [Rhynchospora pubera]|uniref:ATP synthase subunit b n=1 Tax=Rhynchospora pubera TaxID=906938 RepID=A0AAV8HSL8_9POAL|nr:ATP synthase subunit b [Rhynchospora pubera]